MMRSTRPCRLQSPIDCRNRLVRLLQLPLPGGGKSFAANHETSFAKFLFVACLWAAAAAGRLCARVPARNGRALHPHVRALPLASVFTRTGVEGASLEAAYLRLYANGDSGLANKHL